MKTRIIGVLEKFIFDWKNAPSLYENEIVIQAELLKRFKDACEEWGLKKFKYEFDEYRTILKEQIWERVVLEPALKLKTTKYPDLVIWDDFNAEKDCIENWPIMFALEIKLGDKETVNSHDLNKLITMKNHCRVSYLCRLAFWWNNKEDDIKYDEDIWEFKIYNNLNSSSKCNISKEKQ